MEVVDVHFSPATIRSIFLFIEERICGKVSSVAAAPRATPPPQFDATPIVLPSGFGKPRPPAAHAPAAAGSATSAFRLALNKLSAQKEKEQIPALRATIAGAAADTAERAELGAVLAAAAAATPTLDATRHRLLCALWTAATDLLPDMHTHIIDVHLRPYLHTVLTDPQFLTIDWNDVDASDNATRAAHRFQSSLSFLVGGAAPHTPVVSDFIRDAILAPVQTMLAGTGGGDDTSAASARVLHLCQAARAAFGPVPHATPDLVLLRTGLCDLIDAHRALLSAPVLALRAIVGGAPPHPAAASGAAGTKEKAKEKEEDEDGWTKAPSSRSSGGRSARR